MSKAMFYGQRNNPFLALLALAVAFFFGLAPVNFPGARISTASGSERGFRNQSIDGATRATARGIDPAEASLNPDFGVPGI